MKKEKLTNYRAREKFKASPKKMSKSCETSRPTSSRAFALLVAALLTAGHIPDALAENCKDWNREKIVKVLKNSSFGRERLSKALECLDKPEQENPGDYRCLVFKKNGKEILFDCEDNKEKWQTIEPFSKNIFAERYPKTQSAQMKPASGFKSAQNSSSRESDAAREVRLLREQLARAEEERIRRENDRRAEEWRRRTYD